MDFVLEWLCYLVAFVAGSALAWVIASIAVKRGTEEHVSGNMSGQEVGKAR